MKEKHDLTGQKFNDLVVVRFVGRNNSKTNTWECLCMCGKKTIVDSSSLRSGHTKSCGCRVSRVSTTHGFSTRRESIEQRKFYNTWRSMKKRTLLDSRSDIKNYKGRGIVVCKRWMKFENFKEDMWDSFNNHINKFGIKKTSIDRINNDGNYLKSNCKWSTPREQCQNRTNNRFYTLSGITKTQSEWARELGIKDNSLDDRINKLHWPLEKALTKCAFQSRLYIHNGERCTLKRLSVKYNIKLSTLWYRVNRQKLSLADALTKKIVNHKNGNN